MRKKILLCGIVVTLMGLASCSTINRTATATPVETEVCSHNTADLVVSPNKISYTLRPSSAIRRGGKKNVINAAISEALKANGNADVLVGMQYELKTTRNFFGKSNIKYVTVEGYPATYQNIKPSCKNN